MPAGLVVARAMLHLWEEPILSGKNGAGCIFFSGCNLGCVFCQNGRISHENFGKVITPAHLREIMEGLIAQGAHCIDLVTPTHFTPWVLEALEKPLGVPVVWNSGGYERVETLRTLEGKVQIYLPDLKYAMERPARELSAAPDYFAQARPAIEAMMTQAGHPVFDSEGILQRGVILRHLALPGHVDDSFAVLDQMAAWNKADPGCFLPSVMSQYTPFYQAADHGIGRRITTYEYRRVVNYAMDLGLSSGYMQQKSSAKEEYTPSFDLTGV
jgi:putative pyruvate formate lyase activating enzyme